MVRMTAQGCTEPTLLHPVYLDCAATTPLESDVREVILQFLDDDYGNAGSRTHEYGTRASKAIEQARAQVAELVAAKPNEVIFTSGATEADNLAILGLAAHGEESGRKHIVSTAIEHNAVLEPLEALTRRGFVVDLIAPTSGGWVAPEAVSSAVRPDTLLVSVMHVNNETGVIQPIREICQRLMDKDLYFHVDAAQGFAKDVEALCDERIDLISASAHKIHGPKGVGALIARRRGFNRVPLRPLLFGGGQERGLRPGTLPVALIAGFGAAVGLAKRKQNEWRDRCAAYRHRVLEALRRLDPVFNGDQARTLPHILNISFPGLDSEAVMVALKDLVAISNGSACTSQSYEPSHVLQAMDLDGDIIAGAIRISWSHSTPDADWKAVAERIDALR